MPTPKVLTRRELYDLVWSKPMRDLAADFDISDVGLGKICDRHRVPKPGRGYWAKLQAGKKVAKAIFREVDNPILNRIEIRPVIQHFPTAAQEVVEKAKAERKAAKPAPRARAAPVSIEPVQDVHKAIKRTARVLRKGKPDANGAVQAIGDELCGVDVAITNVERVITFLDTLACKLKAKGLPLESTGNAMCVAAGSDSATFTIKERTRREKHIPSLEDLAAEERRQKKLHRYWNSSRSSDHEGIDLFGRAYPKFDVVYTGALVFQIEGYSDGVRRKWADGKTQTIESFLDDITVGLEVLLAVRKAAREKWEEREHQWQQLALRRELARKRTEREQERAAYLSRIINLHQEIKQLRQWLADVESASEGGADSDFVRMVDWARQRLATLEATVRPKFIDQDLQSEELFPEVDALYDPEGDPPNERYPW